jgi:hypothetical protein
MPPLVTQSGTMLKAVGPYPNQPLFGLEGSDVTLNDLKQWIPIILGLGGIIPIWLTARPVFGEKRYSVPKWAAIVGTAAIIGSLGYSLYLLHWD